MARERPTLRRTSLAEIMALRHAVLRPGLPPESAVFAGDDAPETRHYGAFSGDAAVGCLSLMRQDREGRPAFQLRGMATRDDRRGEGVGRDLMAHAVADTIAATGIRGFWCNARTESAGFYARQGWAVVSEPFDIPGVGPHVVMVFAR